MRTNWDYIAGYKEEVSALIQQRLEELYADKTNTALQAEPVSGSQQPQIYARIGARVEIPAIYYTGHTVAACA